METNREIEAPAPIDIEAAVHTLDRDAIVVANAGAGKTYLLVEHYFALLESGLDPAQLAAFTFTEKAAKELKERILKRLDSHPAFCELPEELLQEWRRKLLGASIGTIHQFCLQLIDAARPAGQRKAFKVVDEALEETLRAERLRAFLRERFLAEDPDALRLLKAFGIGKLRELIFARVEMFYAEGPAAELPAAEPAEAELLRSLESLARPFLEGLDRRKAELGWMSFSDMERRALELLNRPNEALRKFLKPLQHFLVDEFQDTSPIQIRLLQALRQARGPGSRPRLFAVGDPKQSIYRFRDVDRHLIARTQEEILGDGGRRFDSAMNWRSAPILLDLVNRYSAAAFPADLPSRPTREADPAAFARLIELQAGEKKSNAEEQAEREAAAVSGAIAELLKETPAEEIAVLYRTSGAVEALIRVLQERGIPYCIRGGQNLFERQEIFDLHRLVYFLGNSKDDLSLVGVLRSPLFLLSDAALFFLGLDRSKEESFWEHLLKEETLSRLRSARPEEAEKFLACREELGRLMAQAASQSPSRLLERLIRRGGWGELYALASGEEQRWLAIEQWLDWLKTLEEDEAPLTWTEVSRRLRETAELQPTKTPLGDLIAARGSVQLLTLHKAKGLEFDTVFMVGMNKTPKPDYPLLQRLGGQAALKVPDPREEKGLRPSPRYLAIQEIHKSEEAEENKRLLYVGLTRAKRRLFVVLQPGPGTKGTLQHLLKQSLGEDWVKWRGELPRSEAPSFRGPEGAEESPTTLVGMRSLPPVSLEPGGVRPGPPLGMTNAATVSELETFQVCPLKHHLAYRLQVPQEAAELRPPIEATAIGTLLHEALNLLHLAPERRPEEAIALALDSGPWAGDAELGTRLTESLRKYLDSDLYRSIAAAAEDYSELPFILRLGEVDLRGQIDRLSRDSEGWHLIDFKYSDRPTSPKELLSAYGFQLKTYALAASRLLRSPIRRAQIHVLNRAEKHDFHFSDAEIEAHAGELEKLTASWAAKPDLDSIRWRPACAQCSFHRAVPLCPVPHGRSFRE